MKHLSEYKTLCDIPRRNAELFGSRISHRFRTSSGYADKTFSAFYSDIKALTCGLVSFGVTRGAHVSFFSDNRYEWALTDYALMCCGAVSVPRGSDTTAKEQKFIYSHSDSTFVVMEDTARLKEFLKEFAVEDFKLLNKIFLMTKTDDLSDMDKTSAEKIIFFEDLLASGRTSIKNSFSAFDKLVSQINNCDIATIIYTSGTSGNPKGVMLTHANFLHNVKNVAPRLGADITAAERAVCILPSWHVYERAFEYCSAAYAVCLFYSDINHLQEDLVNEKPHMFASVPRLWEIFYTKILSKVEKSSPVKKIIFSFFLFISEARLTALNKVKKHFVLFSSKKPAEEFIFIAANRLLLIFLYPLYLASKAVFKPVRAIFGGNLRASFSAGGSLPPYIDLFFNSTGVNLVNAYGMTETSPGTITRMMDRNTLGTIGVPVDETEVKIITEAGMPAAPGEKGIIYVRGAQVMKGYYKNPEATKEILSEDGWLNTGDLGTFSISGDILMTGRAKSTIVLLGGENAEPEPIEEKLKESHLIDHAVVVGQDRKGLTAILTWNEEKLKHLADKLKISFDDLMSKGEDIIKHADILKEYRKEIKKHINKETGFKPSDHIISFVLLKKRFTIGDELTQTLKVRRRHVENKYKHLL